LAESTARVCGTAPGRRAWSLCSRYRFAPPAGACRRGRRRRS